MTTRDLQRMLLSHVGRPDYKPVKPRVIAKQLGLPKDRHADLKRAVKELVKQGRLGYGSGHLVKPADRKVEGPVTGVFHRAAGGFGFVRPSGMLGRGDRSGDIYIPEKRSRDAATGDLVSVRLQRRRGGPDRRIAGEIVQVLERATHQFVGTYFEAAGSGFVQVDGKIFAQPILVGDPGAKGAKPDDKVVIEMVRFPAQVHSGEAVITEVLGPRGQPGVDTLSIIREFGLPEEFPEKVLDAARRQAEQFDESVGQGRLDLTDRTVVTIDPEDARDFDDAISLERIERGHWLLGVHIADVAHFVRPRSVLDHDARDRGTSVYLPDRVIPMLPEVISNNLASLQPGRVRYTKSAFIELTPDGARVGTEVHSAAIKSRRRLTYDEVDDYLAHRRRWKKRLAPEVFELLGRMHELAMILRKRRSERGAIELTMREVELDLDRCGRVCGAHATKHTESHQIIEEFMLAANEAVAEMLRDRGIDFLRRVHESPDPRKLDMLTEFVKELGLQTESLQSRFEIQRLLKKVRGRAEEHAVNYAVLRSMQKAIYSPQDEGHYALAGDCYCHFTSPIRRYPDLTIHRLIDAIVKKRKPASDFAGLVVLGQHCSDREQRAEAAERELVKLKLLNYLDGRIGEQMDAVITGVADYGLFAEGLDLPAEGLIHIQSLQDDYYQYDKTTHSLTGRRAGNRFRLGDRVRVEIARVDIDRRELDLRLVAQLKHPQAAKKPRLRPKAKKKSAATDKKIPKKTRRRKSPRRR